MAGTKSLEEVISLIRYIGVNEQRIAVQICAIKEQLKEIEFQTYNFLVYPGRKDLIPKALTFLGGGGFIR